MEQEEVFQSASRQGSRNSLHPEERPLSPAQG
uniref:Uncharacterized protein n=1 Tax=Amphimedon queenslandica TaxID=400682 RepID=A0A1X7V0H8_AMPQE